MGDTPDSRLEAMFETAMREYNELFELTITFED
jgi:hypothetical protein